MKKLWSILILFGSVLLLAGCSSSPKYSNLDEFAQCLTDAGVKFYGTTTCQYCLQQKESFGTSFSKINFTDCTKNPIQCDLAKVSKIPHWSISSSVSLNGFQELETLSKETWCELIANTSS